MFERKNSPGLVIELQMLASTSNPDLTSLLRKAKVAANKLHQKGAVSWIDSELNGYSCGIDDLPRFRRARGEMKVKNPYHGLQPYHLPADIESIVTQAPIFQGVAEIERLLADTNDESVLSYSIAPEIRAKLIEWQEFAPMEPVLVVSKAVFDRVLAKVTSLVLDWSLELEANGVKGEGMSFSEEEKHLAAQPTNTIIAQQVGQIGNAYDNARIEVSQEANTSFAVDGRKLNEFVGQLDDLLPQLPSSVGSDLAPLVNRLKGETDQGSIRSVLQSMKDILEGAGGNLVAQGIIAGIGTLLP